MQVKSGVCLGFGGTHARRATCTAAGITDFISIETPATPPAFFAWLAEQLLAAAADGHHWLVAGFPGPVSYDGTSIGPMANVSGLKDTTYDLRQHAMLADGAVAKVLADGFTLIAVNDGDLAAHAAADRISRGRFDRVAALIIGSGVGAGLVVRDKQNPAIFRAERDHSLEIGHGLRSADPQDTWENFIAGPALQRRYGGTEPRAMPADHLAWREVGQSAAILALNLGLVNHAELVVPTGGVGAGAARKYEEHLKNVLDHVRQSGNETQRHLLPQVEFVSPPEAHEFEMYGAVGVMRDFMTRDRPSL